MIYIIIIGVVLTSCIPSISAKIIKHENIYTQTATITFFCPDCITTIIFDGKSYRNSESVVVEYGEYPDVIGGPRPRNCQFDKWVTSGGVSVSIPEGEPTTVYVEGDGTLTINSHYVNEFDVFQIIQSLIS